MNPILWPDHAMPSADDPSETLEQSIARLTRAIDAHVARLTRIRHVLRVFYLSPMSAHSLTPVLALAEELNPGIEHEDDVPARHAPVEPIINADTAPF